MVRVSRRQFLAAAGASVLAGCLGGSDDTPTPTDVTATAPEEWPPTAEETLLLSRSPGEFRDQVVNVVGRDQIPSIDEPPFLDPDAAGEFLDPDDVVLGVERGGVAKAYPRSIMVHHEICNDSIDGDRVSVTYCPLTGTALGFERGPVTFGVSGRLVNNNLVMYDRATETWWPQVLGTSIPGSWNRNPGTASLREFRVIWTTWERWREHHPDTAVLSRNTGHIRNYDSDPYNGSYTPKRGYYAAGGPFYASLSDDDRFGPKEVVLGARAPGGAVAFQKGALRDAKVMEGSLGGTPVLAVHDPRYDTGFVYRNPDEATYEFSGGELVGPEGEAHAPDALPLERIHAFDAMWFAWIGFYPDSNVYS